MTSTEPPRVGEQRPGGRSARVRYDVLAAAAAVLAEVGYDNVTIDEVAKRAGVHKTTVYRRWPTKADLITEAATEQSARAIPVPDTGSLAGDLRQLARSVAANITSSQGRTQATSLIAAASSSEELADGMHQFWNERIEITGEVVRRAIDRGELAADTDVNLVIETLIGPLWVRLLLTGEPIDDRVADEVADLVSTGLRRS